MARPARQAREVRVLERGSILFLARTQRPDGVQRILVVLAPYGGAPMRLIAIGRKRLGDAGRHERFWGFVALVRADPREVAAELGKARLVGEGAYALATHGEHTHIVYELSPFDEGPLRRELAIEPRASYIVTVMNPDPAAWGMAELPPLQLELFEEEDDLPVATPTPFPPDLQQRFRDRRYAQLETPAFLDHPGAELVFIGASEDAGELGIDLDPTWERASRMFGDIEV